MPGSPEMQDHLAVAVLGPGPALEQDAELVLAPDQRREMLAVERLEAAFGATLALDPPGGERLGEALEAPRAEIGQLEEATDQPARGLADDHGPRRRERLQSCGEVRRLADHRLLLRGTLADQIADHHLAGRDAGSHRQCPTIVGGEAADRLGEVETRPDRALGVVLMRLRKAEIGEHAIAHELRDVALVAADDLAAGALVGGDHRPHVFRIEPRRQRGRADQIAEQHRELPAFRLGPRGGRRDADIRRQPSAPDRPARRSPSAASCDGRARCRASRSPPRPAPAGLGDRYRGRQTAPHSGRGRSRRATRQSAP